jgi:membrane protein YdbS with pleckstrin-like domain
MENLFTHILDEDEKIIKVFKPHKAKLFASAIILNSLWLFWFMIFGVFAVLFPDEGEVINKIYVLIPIALYLAIIGIIILFTALHYKNVYYAYSNKRIIIRSGIFGVDYKSLDMSMIGAVDVYVSLLDKIMKKNTGSLTFGSAASPVGGNNANGYRFNHVKMPYETCKEIKSYIDSYKKSLNSK